MSIQDKRGLLQVASQEHPVEIELGCGPAKRHGDSIGIDALNYPAVDVCGDVFEVLDSLPNASVKTCYSYHFLEHVSDVVGLFERLERVVRPQGTLRFVVPHFSNPYFYSDYTHARFFGLYSMSYLCNDSMLARKVPRYQKTLGFRLLDVNLGFKSDRAFPVRRGIKAALGALLNATSWTKEFYEENLCYWFPCYEIEYKIERSDEGH